jgi:hypothetical protein
MQDAEHVNTIIGTVHGVQEEVPGRPATLRDVQEPPVRWQAFTMMTEVWISTDALARFGDQRAIPWHLQRSELSTGRAKDLTDVGLRDVA